MSDFTAGQVVANIRRDADVAASDNVAWAWKGRAEDLEAQLARAQQSERHWQGLAQQLQQKLAATELQSVKGVVNASAAVDVARELREHLAELAPNDPLARKEETLRRHLASRRKHAEARGFRIVNDDTFELELIR